MRALPVSTPLGLLMIAAFGALIVCLPIAALVHYALQGSGGIWAHLAEYVLPQAFLDSLILLFGVGSAVIILGSGLAWLMTAFDFPGRRLLQWALLLPLSVPTYIIAYSYLDLWHPVGPLQTALRELLGYSSPKELRLPDIRSMGGCITLLSLVLYPYVYLPARAAFQMEAASFVEASSTLGMNAWQSFVRVALPLARPAVVAGASLALMEALNDIGAAEFLGVRTLTVSVYLTWINHGSLAGAAQIALLMLGLVMALMALERWGRAHQRYAGGGRSGARLTPKKLTGARAVLASAAAFTPVFFGFILPFAYLCHAAIERIQSFGLEGQLFDELVNTVRISAIATLMILVFAFVLAFLHRCDQAFFSRLMIRLAGFGYAIPGTVLAIGLLSPLSAFDRWVSSVSDALLGMPTGLILSGSGMALVYAYFVRFLSIGSSYIEAGLNKIPRSLDDAARVLGAAPSRLGLKIHLPLASPAVSAAALLVFVDCMKELPASLLLRPLNFETLSTHLYAEAARGSYESGALAALLIVLVGLLPLTLLSRLRAS